jgi:hypothetical protein
METRRCKRCAKHKTREEFGKSFGVKNHTEVMCDECKKTHQIKLIDKHNARLNGRMLHDDFMGVF